MFNSNLGEYTADVTFPIHLFLYKILHLLVFGPFKGFVSITNPTCLF